MPFLLKKISVTTLIFILFCSYTLFLVSEKKEFKEIFNYEKSLKIKEYRDHFEVYSLNNNDLRIWNTKENINRIDSLFFYDIDNDGTEEIINLFWRYGDYNEKADYLKPIVGDDKLSQHINIYATKPYIHLIWGGSSLHEPIIDLKKCNKDLCAKESTYAQFPFANKNIDIKWNEWWWEKEYLN